jgi:dipeptidase E
MDQVRKSHFYELIRKFIHKGGVINGDSAGAIILGSHLETAHFGAEGDDNETDLISYQGLNLIGNIAIHCHYEEVEASQITSFVNEYGFSVIALNEASGVVIINDTLRVISAAGIDFYNLKGSQKLKYGDKIVLSKSDLIS